MPLKLVTDTLPPDGAARPQPEGAVLRLVWPRTGVGKQIEPSELVIRAGDTVLLQGADRAARAAVMRAAAGLYADANPARAAPRGVGAVLREPTLPYAATPLDTIMACAPLDPVAAAACLTSVGLQDVADRPLNTLGTVELRLLRLSSACAAAPGALILDGLFDGVEMAARRRLVRAFALLRAAGRLGVLLCCDDRLIGRMLATREILLGAGPGGSGQPVILEERPAATRPVLVTHLA